jgi:hypothetical protein
MLSHHRFAFGGLGVFNSYNNAWIHIISAVAFANALYSDSVLDHDTVAYFPVLHDTRFEVRYTAKPHVDRRSSKLPSQSASEYGLASKELDLHILIPILVHALR